MKIGLHLGMLPSFYKELKPIKCVMRWNTLPRIAKCHGPVLWIPCPSIAHERNVLKMLFSYCFSWPTAVKMYTGFEGKKFKKEDSWGAGREGLLCWPSGKSDMSSMLWKRTRFGKAEEVPGGAARFTHVSIFYVAKGWFCLKPTWKYSSLGFQVNLLLSPWEQVNMLL